jgi:hypothetical protein
VHRGEGLSHRGAPAPYSSGRRSGLRYAATAARRITALTNASPQSGQEDIRVHERRSPPHDSQW